MDEPTITSEDMNEILRLIDEMKIDISEIQELVELFSYQRFSPEMVLERFEKIKAEKGIEESVFQEDLRSLIRMGIEWDRRVRKSVTKRKATALINKYQIKRSVQHDRKAITLHRILAAFPIQTVKLLKDVPVANYNNVFGCIELPYFMKISVFPSLIPKANLKETIRETLLLVVSCYTAEQYMAQSGLKNYRVAVLRAQHYAKVSYDSTLPEEEKRRETFLSFEFPLAAIKNVVDKYNENTRLDINVDERAVWVENDLKVI
ncbi:hypothetical protein K3495_g2831 [Podosphaera aphanis]|nr:hypothetical protein K3495_g2831 [Podosphaera aphanis]